MKTIRVSQLIPRQLILVDHLIDQVPRASFVPIRPRNTVFLHEVFDCFYVEMKCTRISVPLFRIENFVEICARKVTFAEVLVSHLDTSIDFLHHFLRVVNCSVQWQNVRRTESHLVIERERLLSAPKTFLESRLCVVQVDFRPEIITRRERRADVIHFCMPRFFWGDEQVAARLGR